MLRELKCRNLYNFENQIRSYRQVKRKALKPARLELALEDLSKRMLQRFAL